MPCTNHLEVEDAIRPCARCRQEFCDDCLVELGPGSHCIDCKREYVRDLLSGVDSVSIELASVGRRFFALVLDQFIIAIPVGAILVGLMVLLMTMEALDDPSLFMGLLALSAIPAILYEALMLRARGQTLGKMALGIKVVKPDGTDISGKQAWGRTFMRLVFQWMSFFQLFNYLPALLTKEKTCIHDLAAGTRVVRWRL